MLDNFLRFSACAHATCEPSSSVDPYTHWFAIFIEQTLHLPAFHSRLYITPSFFASVFISYSILLVFCSCVSLHFSLLPFTTMSPTFSFLLGLVALIPSSLSIPVTPTLGVPLVPDGNPLPPSPGGWYDIPGTTLCTYFPVCPSPLLPFFSN